VFLLLRPPFLTEQEGIVWAKRSLDAAFDAGAEVCCVIPTRAGNGAMEALAAAGDYAPPSLASLEAVQEYGLALGRGRVFADLWDAERFYACACSPARAARLAAMNRTQQPPPPVACKECGSA
ncbi:MAG: radical SAM protein, partial [Armatimonadetes bacterium]|nr:radical SAM protein [Armatimonadota bacterium]